MPDKGRIPVSVCIIALNEEERIKDCLESVRDFSEIVLLLDSRTNDRTAEIGRTSGAMVFVEEWKGFGPQKQSAVDKCSSEWVFVLDADERIPPETVKVIAQAVANAGADAFSFPRKNFLHGRWMRRGDWWPDRQIRLFRKTRGRFVSMVHERWDTAGKISELDCPLHHYPFRGYSDMIKTMNDYSTLIAADMYARGKRTTASAAFVHGMVMFVKLYFLKLGFLEGLDGLVTGILKASGSFFKYAKLHELQKQGRPAEKD